MLTQLLAFGLSFTLDVCFLSKSKTFNFFWVNYDKTSFYSAMMVTYSCFLCVFLQVCICNRTLKWQNGSLLFLWFKKLEMVRILENKKHWTSSSSGWKFTKLPMQIWKTFFEIIKSKSSFWCRYHKWLMVTTVKIVNDLFLMNDWFVKASESYKNPTIFSKKFCEFPPWHLWKYLMNWLGGTWSALFHIIKMQSFAPIRSILGWLIFFSSTSLVDWHNLLPQ